MVTWVTSFDAFFYASVDIPSFGVEKNLKHCNVVIECWSWGYGYIP